MPKIVTIKGEMIRISPDGKKIEYSKNKGSSWNGRSSLSSSFGVGIDLLEFEGELLLLTDKKLLYSKSKGSSWNARSSITSSMGKPQSLSDGGKELLLSTNKKLFYSKSKGSSWNAR